MQEKITSGEQPRGYQGLEMYSSATKDFVLMENADVVISHRT